MTWLVLSLLTLCVSPFGTAPVLSGLLNLMEPFVRLLVAECLLASLLFRATDSKTLQNRAWLPLLFPALVFFESLRHWVHGVCIDLEYGADDALPAWPEVVSWLVLAVWLLATFTGLPVTGVLQACARFLVSDFVGSGDSPPSAPPSPPQSPRGPAPSQRSPRPASPTPPLAAPVLAAPVPAAPTTSAPIPTALTRSGPGYTQFPVISGGSGSMRLKARRPALRFSCKEVRARESPLVLLSNTLPPAPTRPATIMPSTPTPLAMPEAAVAPAAQPSGAAGEEETAVVATTSSPQITLPQLQPEQAPAPTISSPSDTSMPEIPSPAVVASTLMDTAMPMDLSVPAPEQSGAGWAPESLSGFWNAEGGSTGSGQTVTTPMDLSDPSPVDTRPDGTILGAIGSSGDGDTEMTESVEETVAGAGVVEEHVANGDVEMAEGGVWAAPPLEPSNPPKRGSGDADDLGMSGLEEPEQASAAQLASRPVKGLRSGRHIALPAPPASSYQPRERVEAPGAGSAEAHAVGGKKPRTEHHVPASQVQSTQARVLALSDDKLDLRYRCDLAMKIVAYLKKDFADVAGFKHFNPDELNNYTRLSEENGHLELVGNFFFKPAKEHVGAPPFAKVAELNAYYKALWHAIRGTVAKVDIIIGGQPEGSRQATLLRTKDKLSALEKNLDK